MARVDQEWIVLAKVLRSRGNRGEVLIRLETSDPGQFETGGSFTLRHPGGASRELVLDAAWQHQDRWVLKFRGVESIDEAEALRGFEVSIPADQRRQADDDEFFFNDLIGLRMLDQTSREDIGQVESWQETGGPILLVVKTAAGEEILVPFIEPVCPVVDLEKGEILAALPEGLRELNRR